MLKWRRSRKTLTTRSKIASYLAASHNPCESVGLSTMDTFQVKVAAKPQIPNNALGDRVPPLLVVR